MRRFLVLGFAIALSIIAAGNIAEASQGVRTVSLELASWHVDSWKYPVHGAVTVMNSKRYGRPILLIKINNLACEEDPDAFYTLYAIIGDGDPIRLRNFNPNCRDWMFHDEYRGTVVKSHWLTQPITFEVWRELDDGIDSVYGPVRELFLYGSD